MLAYLSGYDTSNSSVKAALGDTRTDRLMQEIIHVRQLLDKMYSLEGSVVFAVEVVCQRHQDAFDNC